MNSDQSTGVGEVLSANKQLVAKVNYFKYKDIGCFTVLEGEGRMIAAWLDDSLHLKLSDDSILPIKLEGGRVERSKAGEYGFYIDQRIRP